MYIYDIFDSNNQTKKIDYQITNPKVPIVQMGYLMIFSKHFYKFAGTLISAYTSQYNTIMSNRKKQIVDTLSYRNTLDCYFKTNNTENIQLSKTKEVNYKDDDVANVKTNCTYASVEIDQNYDQENDNSNQNCINFSQLQRVKNKTIEVANDDHEESAHSHTMARVKPNKIKLGTLDDQQTKKFSKVVNEAIKQQIKKQNALENTEKKQKMQKGRKSNKVNPFDSSIDLGLQNKADSVQQILRKQPLRSKFSHLLKDDQKFSIGYQHNKLLKLLRTIDTTIDFIKNNRRVKSIFFGDIQKSLKEINRQDVAQSQLQQLLFLDDTLFAIEWAMSDRVKAYDLLLHSPVINSEDQRVSAVRKKLVNYLMAKETQFLSNNSPQKKDNSMWVVGFDPNNVELPTLALPPHPHLRNAEIRCLSNSKIEAVPNPHLRQIIKDQKDKSDAQSLKSKDVANMIFGKHTSKDIQQKLYIAIKQKSEKIAKMNLAEACTKISKTDLTNIADEIMMAYMGKGVSNIFKQTLIDILNSKLRIKLPLIVQGLRIIVDDHKDIGFLKQINTSNGTVVLQINRTKFSSLMKVVKQYE